MPQVSVIVVNHNGKDLLPDCLGGLREQTFRDFEVIFVDNGSADGSAAAASAAAAFLPGLKVITLQENSGFAGGNNIGIRAASGPYLVLLNNDTRADKNFLAELVAAIERQPQAGAAAPKILNFFAPRTIDSVGGLLLTRDGLGQGRGRGEEDRGQYDHLAEALCPSGCAALFRRVALDECGLFDEEFFAYCEDADLGLRLLRAGWFTVPAPRAIVYHKYSASAGAYSPLKLRLVERNHYGVALKNFPLRLLAPLPLWTLYRWLVMGCALICGRGRGQAGARTPRGALLKAFLLAQVEALCRVPAWLRRRPRLRKLPARQFAQLLAAQRVSIREVFFKD